MPVFTDDKIHPSEITAPANVEGRASSVFDLFLHLTMQNGGIAVFGLSRLVLSLVVVDTTDRNDLHHSERLAPQHANGQLTTTDSFFNQPVPLGQFGKQGFQFLFTFNDSQPNTASLVGRLDDQIVSESSNQITCGNLAQITEESSGSNSNAGFPYPIFRQVLFHAQLARGGTASGVLDSALIQESLQGAVFSKSSVNGGKHDRIRAVQVGRKSSLLQVHEGDAKAVPQGG